jgi:hypothetical protein
VFGPIDQPGFRLKVDGFASVNGETNANVFSSAFMASDLKALSDVMAGYQFNWESVWVKLYAGAAHQAQTLAFWQVGQLVRQQSYGATGALETFWQGSNGFWGSGNLSWLQFNNTGQSPSCAFRAFHVTPKIIEESAFYSGLPFLPFQLISDTVIAG